MKKLLLISVSICAGVVGLSYPYRTQGINLQPGLESHGNPLLKEPLKTKEAPPSRTHKQIRIDESVTYRLPPPDGSAPATGKGRPLQIGVTRQLSLNPLEKSKWFSLGRGGQVAVFGIISAGALQLRVRFTDVALPRGAKIFVSSLKNPDEYYGPFDGRGPNNDGTFWTPPVTGEGVMIEYFIPGRSSQPKSGPSPFMVSEVSHIFR